MRYTQPLDSIFIHLEKRSAPGIIAGLYVLDPTTAPDKFVRHKDILKYVEDRLHLIPAFRQRLVFHPLGLDDPCLIDDESFDLEFHVRHIGLPQPRDRRQLNILLARLFSRPMDMDRPLWELYVIEGLENVEGFSPDCFAILLKLHHTAFDGMSSVAATFSLMQNSPDELPPSPTKRWVPERKPNQLEWFANTVMRSTQHGVRNTLKFPSIARSIYDGWSAATSDKESASDRVPYTLFNGSVSSHRVFDYVELPIGEMLEFREHIGKPKLNDIALCVIAGGVRRYLSEHKALPPETLHVGMPIDVRDANDREAGNKVAMVTVPMGTDIEDPIERIEAIRENTQRGKNVNSAMGGSFAQDALSYFPYPVRAASAGRLNEMVARKYLSPFLNCIATNVPMPGRDEIYFAGGRLLSASGMGPVFDGVGLFHTITSVKGNMSISVTSCREMMRDVEFYAECLRESFNDLRTEALKRKSSDQQASPTRKTKRVPQKRKRSTSGNDRVVH